MPHGKNKNRSAPSSGTIRKKTVSRNGTEYIYWEARFTTGYDPGTGRQIQRSITGKTQKEVAQKLRQATAEIDHGIYIESCRIALGDWMDIWAKTYLVNVKPRTVIIYEDHIRLHIKPALGAIRLEELTTHTIQRFYNGLALEDKNHRSLSPKTIRSIHGVLHSALRKAVQNNYIRFNPSKACTLPRNEKRELKPLDEAQIADFLIAIQGHRFEDIFLVALFTGMREGEILGLTWDCVDFGCGTILINKQIQLHQEKGMDAYAIVSTKNGKARTIAAAPTVMAKLRHRRAVQAQDKLYAGSAWQDTELVFTNALGGHLTKSMVYRDFKKVIASIGRPDARFHDLRHSHAVAAIRSGDDIKTVQGNLGHATAAFTLDVYGHVTDQMKQASAARMEKFIKSVSGQ